jgi:anti-sigma factor RsiW
MNKKSECKFRSKLNSYLDNELSEAEFVQLKTHILSCPACQEEIRELNKLNNFLSDFQEVDVPLSVKENIISQVSEISRSAKFKGNRFVKIAVAASIAASFIIGLLFSNITFTENSNSLSDFSLGQESLYSYYVTE